AAGRLADIADPALVRKLKGLRNVKMAAEVDLRPQELERIPEAEVPTVRPARSAVAQAAGAAVGEEQVDRSGSRRTGALGSIPDLLIGDIVCLAVGFRPDAADAGDHYVAYSPHLAIGQQDRRAVPVRQPAQQRPVVVVPGYGEQRHGIQD